MAKEFFDNLGKTISKVAEDAVSKTEDFFTVTKIKGKIAEEKRMIEKLCCKIGHEVYKEYQSGTAFSDILADLCASIEKHEEEIIAQQKSLELFNDKKASENEEAVTEEDVFEEEDFEENLFEEQEDVVTVETVEE